MTEYLHPGVYVAEVAFHAHPIEGVSTTQPDWTDANTHDPGITLLELLAFAAESLYCRLGPPHAPHLGAVIAPSDGDPDTD